jgi:hypothetical protein
LEIKELTWGLLANLPEQADFSPFYGRLASKPHVEIGKLFNPQSLAEGSDLFPRWIRAISFGQVVANRILSFPDRFGDITPPP